MTEDSSRRKIKFTAGIGRATRTRSPKFLRKAESFTVIDSPFDEERTREIARKYEFPDTYPLAERLNAAAWQYQVYSPQQHAHKWAHQRRLNHFKNLRYYVEMFLKTKRQNFLREFQKEIVRLDTLGCGDSSYYKTMLACRLHQLEGADEPWDAKHNLRRVHNMLHAALRGDRKELAALSGLLSTFPLLRGSKGRRDDLALKQFVAILAKIYEDCTGKTITRTVSDDSIKFIDFITDCIHKLDRPYSSDKLDHYIKLVQQTYKAPS